MLFVSSLQGVQNGQLPAPQEKETQPPAPEKIEIKPTARDHEIRDRLEAILNATGWFDSASVQVKEGVVFLSGKTKTDEFKKWAGNLARNTQDVSAVVNKIELIQPSIWDFDPTMAGLEELWRDLTKLLPKLAFAFFIFLLTWLVAKLIMKLSRKILGDRVKSLLLQDVIARGIGFCVFLLGLFIIFKVMGLTTIALTIIGGTGVLGIVIGIAFRDITENLLASVFLSIHHPFRNGDLVEIAGMEGYVQRLTIRSTVLMSLTGNHIQIPNATVYKSNIRNYTINPNRQEFFSIVIGYEEDISKAQEIALKVMEEHPAVLKDPEPLVLVDKLEKASVFLSIYFWLNGQEHSWLKVKSSVIRLVKRAYQNENIAMPGDVHEILFPDDVSVNISQKEKKKEPKEIKPPPESAAIATSAEAGLRSDSEDIQEQAKQSRTPGKGEENLLNHDNDNSPG